MRSRIQRSARPLWARREWGKPQARVDETIAACRRARAFKEQGRRCTPANGAVFLICTNGASPTRARLPNNRADDARPAREFFSHPNTKELQGSHESLHGTTSLLIRFTCVPLRA